jgi:hypothetical protein
MPLSQISLAAGAAAATLGAAGLSGCGAGHRAGSTPAASASAPAGVNPVAVPPITGAQLESGPATAQITATIVAFYRAAWQDQAQTACSLFSPAGVTGFMHAAAVSFPESMNRYSTCEHAMEIYNASLADSAQTTIENDPTFSTSTLDNVEVAYIHVHGDTASAIAPTNVAELINPKRIDLVRTGDRWQINDSKSLNASNLRHILLSAEAEGKLRRHPHAAR